jgi:hypothetical protein
VTDLILYDEDDELEPRRWPWDDLEGEHEESLSAAERNPLLLLP